VSKLWSTTVYEPVNEGGHRAKRVRRNGDSNDCKVCGLPYWNSIHQLAERHVPDAVETVPRLFCVEASDDRGRSYASNGLRWVDVEDAMSWASGLSMRWFGCTDIRVRRCNKDGEPTGVTVWQTLSSER